MKMLDLTILLCLTTIAPAAPPFRTDFDDPWSLYKGLYQKEFGHVEEGRKREVFEQHLLQILKHNINADLDRSSYRLGINQYTDWAPEEFTKFRCFGMNISAKSAHGPHSFLEPLNANIPEEVDWRKQGLVTDIKNQGKCGGCWAFSATGSIEGQQKRKSGNLESLSEQNLIDCSKNGENQGCQGGYFTAAFDYVKEKGIATESAYPYQGVDGTCRADTTKSDVKITGHVELPPNDEQALMKAVATVGPVSVAIDASSPDFQLYKSGIFDLKTCSTTELDHAVLVVGYGSENSKDYWLIKNSWGTSWGEQGYFKLARNASNMCGVATKTSYPLV